MSYSRGGFGGGRGGFGGGFGGGRGGFGGGRGGYNGKGYGYYTRRHGSSSSSYKGRYDRDWEKDFDNKFDDEEGKLFSHQHNGNIPGYPHCRSTNNNNRFEGREQKHHQKQKPKITTKWVPKSGSSSRTTNTAAAAGNSSSDEIKKDKDIMVEANDNVVDDTKHETRCEIKKDKDIMVEANDNVVDDIKHETRCETDENPLLEVEVKNDEGVVKSAETESTSLDSAADSAAASSAAVFHSKLTTHSSVLVDNHPIPISSPAEILLAKLLGKRTTTTTASSTSLIVPSTVGGGGLTMAEAVARGPPRSHADIEQIIAEKRQELALKQSKALIPVLPSKPRNLLVAAGPKKFIKPWKLSPCGSSKDDSSVKKGISINNTTNNSRCGVRITMDNNKASSQTKSRVAFFKSLSLKNSMKKPSSSVDTTTQEEKEEIDFMRSLGWEENVGDDDEGLTEEEMKDFFEKHKNLQP